METPSGLLNSIGLQNPGLDNFLDSYLPRLQRYGVPILVNVVGRSVEDYCQVVSALEGLPLVAGYELNVSCPNVKEGLQFGLDPEATASLVRAVRPLTRGVVMAKLTPNVTDIAEQAVAAQEAGEVAWGAGNFSGRAGFGEGGVSGGGDAAASNNNSRERAVNRVAISLINTVRAMAVDWRSGKSRIGTETGGLSGPAIRPIALRMTMEVARAVRIPVCAIGGICSAQDILEFVSVGATLVQVGTHLYRDPACLEGWLQRLRVLLAEEGMTSLDKLRGSFHH